jgi:hypothetical protein
MQSVIESEFNAHLKTTQATMSAISTQLEMAVNLCEWL